MTSADLIERYNAAWNARDVEAIVAFRATDMVFENHTAGELAVGDEVRGHIAGIFETWPALAFGPGELARRRRLHDRRREDQPQDVYSDSVTILRELGLLPS